MSTPAPWRCPDCLAWLAPHVSEHRCEPPSAAVPAQPVTVPPSGGISVSAYPPETVITVNVSGSAVSERDLADAIERQRLRAQSLNMGPIASMFLPPGLRVLRRAPGESAGSSPPDGAYWIES